MSKDGSLEATLFCDKWRLVRVLGAGGMGTVYEASHRNGKRVAIKILHPELRSNEQARARFEREGMIANRLNHPQVPSVLDDGQTPAGDAFLVMDLLHGETLESRSKACRLSLSEIQRVALAVLDVLASAHDKGIVHRDIKPSNVFLSSDGSVKVLDFGVARMHEGSADQDSVALSRGGIALGTPSFMAPEQARGHWDQVDARTDIWNVGALMFALLTGRNVHDGKTSNELMILSATSPAPPVAAIRPELPAALARVVDRALSFHAELRWPDARSMHGAIQALQLEATREESATDEGSLRAIELSTPSTTSDQLSAVVEVRLKPRRAGLFSLAATIVLSSIVVAWVSSREDVKGATPQGDRFHASNAGTLPAAPPASAPSAESGAAARSAPLGPPSAQPPVAVDTAQTARVPRFLQRHAVALEAPLSPARAASAVPSEPPTSIPAASPPDAWLERQK